jgi:hypothetical protein
MGSSKGFESLLEHDSKAHPPFVCPRSLVYMHIQLLEVRAKQDDVYATGFNLSLCRVRNTAYKQYSEF